MTWRKRFLFLIIPAFVAMFLTLELVFRFAIPASNLPHAYFDPNDRAFKFDVNGSRTGTHTMGNPA